MTVLLHKVRLSWFFFIFFTVFIIATFTIPERALEPAALAMFSVNSFLYGFYIAPVLGRQSARIDELNKAVRAESIALFDMLLRTKTLHARTRNKIQEMFEQYIQAALRQRRKAEGEEEYEALISYCLKYEGEDKDTVEKILNLLVANQQNRSNLAMQLANRVYSNEWWIMLVLFGITLTFILQLKVGDNISMHIIKALLCTGLSMLMVNLLKLSTLTHKKAKSIWSPLHKLLETRFYRID